MAAELQTITAAITVTQLAWNTCVFFRNVQNADETARRLYQKTRRLHRILQDIRAVLERRQDHRQKNPTLPTEAQTESNINASLDAIKEVLLKIERKIQVLGSSEQLSRSSNAVARLKLTLKQPAIARHESDLETQIQALQISLSALQL